MEWTREIMYGSLHCITGSGGGGGAINILRGVKHRQFTTAYVNEGSAMGQRGCHHRRTSCRICFLFFVLFSSSSFFVLTRMLAVSNYSQLYKRKQRVEKRWRLKKEEGEEKRAPFHDAFSHLNLVRLSPLFCNVKTVGNSPEWDAKRESWRKTHYTYKKGENYCVCYNMKQRLDYRISLAAATIEQQRERVVEGEVGVGLLTSREKLSSSAVELNYHRDPLLLLLLPQFSFCVTLDFHSKPFYIDRGLLHHYLKSAIHYCLACSPSSFGVL